MMKAAVANGKAIKVRTPNATLYVVIAEDEHKNPCMIQIHAGKSGSGLAAWAYGLAEMINLHLENDGSIEDIITKLSNTTSDQVSFTDGKFKIRSDVDGIVYALLRYKYERYKEREEEGPIRKKGRLRKHYEI